MRKLVLFMCLLSASPAMAQVPVLVQHAACPNGRNPGGASSSTPDYICPLPEPSQAGNALLVGITTSTGATLTVSDDKGNTWNQVDTATDGNNGVIAIYIALNVAVGTRSIKLHRSSVTDNTAMSVSEYYNVATSSALDAHHCNIGSASTSVAAGSITPTVSGDLLWQYAVNTSGGGGVPASVASFMVGSQPSISWQFLGTDLNDGDAVQAGVYNTTAAINATFTSGTSRAFDSCVMAIKAANAGNAPTSAFRIIHMLHQNFPVGAANPLPVQFASSGNLLVNSYIGGGSNITGITDTASNTWAATGAAVGNEAITAISQIYYAANATPSNNLRVSVTRNDNARDGTFMMYDFVGAAASPFDRDSGGQTANQLSFVTPFTTCTSCVTPSGVQGNNEVVIANAGWNFGTGFSVSTPATGLFDAATDTGVSIDGPEPADQNNGWMHQYINNTSPVTVSWNMQGSGNPQSEWAGRVAIFKAPRVFAAAGCTQAQVQTAITAEQSGAADGDIITIPAGSCTWTGTQLLNQTFNNSIVIQGAGAISSTTGGASTTGTDQTVIIDNTTASSGSLMKFHTVSGKSFRFTGISVQGNGSSTQESNGIVFIDGSATAVRVDHCHFFIPNNTSQGLALGGGIQGVADHNFFNSNPNDLTNDIGMRNGIAWNGATDGLGNASWSDGDHWGTSSFFFVEDNRFFDGDPLEIDNGGRGVFRYNTVTGTAGTPASAEQMYWHGQQTGANRGGRAMEVYNNTFNSLENGGNNSNPAVSFNSGVLLAWGNSLAGSYKNLIQPSYNFRNQAGGGGLYTYPPPPAGWGFCGSAAGGPTNWDGNHNSSSGYPCLGQPGRGKGDLLSGTNFATLVNSTTGTVAWPHEALSPTYTWLNIYNPRFYTGTPLIGNQCAGSGAAICAENVEYYQQFGNGGNAGSFNGTVGVGTGLLSSRPATCTGGTDPQTSGAAPGVGYWATDTNTLYVCNPTNTWTAYYTPFTYPHPLTITSSSGSGPAPPPAAGTPTFSAGAGTYSSPQSVTISTTTGGATLCYTTDGTTPTANGTGTCTHGTTYSSPVSVSVNTTLQAIASANGFSDSAIANAVYIISPAGPSGVIFGQGTITVNPLSERNTHEEIFRSSRIHPVVGPRA